MGLQSPHGKSSHLNRHPLLERKQQTGKTVVFEGIGFLESGALFENTFFGENLVDSIQPFLRIAAATLEDEAPPDCPSGEAALWKSSEYSQLHLPHCHRLFLSNFLLGQFPEAVHAGYQR